MNYHQITIHTVTEAVEALSDALITLGSGGVEIFDPKDILNQEKDPTAWDYIDEDLMKQLSKDEVLMKCYFSIEDYPDPTSLEELLLKIRQQIENVRQFLPVGSGLIETKLVIEEEWRNAWKKYFKPFRLGHHIVIIPSWIDMETAPGEIRIDIDPGMAFGTGTHETTSMCMEFLEDLVHEGDTVCDIGCGSGILGITAAKVGAAHVICSDLDQDAVRVAKENVEKNHVGNIAEVYHGDLTEIEALRQLKDQGGADGIVANIIADVIIILSENVGEFIKQGGWFVSSGILTERLPKVKEALVKNGFEIIEVKEKGSWSCVCCRRP